MDYIEISKGSIEGFSLNEDDYIESYNYENLKVEGEGKIFWGDEDVKVNLKIDFGITKDCRIFVGKNVRGIIDVIFKGNNSLIYIGNNCMLNSLNIRSSQSDDFIAVGNQVTTTSKNVWISGKDAGTAKPAIIIGDDCMFAYDIVIRNSDAHPIFSLRTEEQINEPKGIVHIEPHVWIGEQVKILKNVEIGACSVVALGSIVTKDIPRFAFAKGSPATAKVNSDIYWARSSHELSRKRAKYFANKYKIIS